MKIKSKQFSIILTVIAVIFLATEILVWLASSSNWLHYVYVFTYFILLLLGGLIGIWSGERLGLDSTFGKSIYTLGIANLILAGGIVLFDVYSQISYSGIFLAMSNALYLLFAPTVAIGMGLMLYLYDINLNGRKIFHIIACIIIGSYISLVALGFPNIRDGSEFVDLIDLLYVISNALLLSLACIMIYVTRKRIYGGLIIYILGIIAQVAGNILFVNRVESQTYKGIGDPSEIAYILSAALISLGIIVLHHTFANRVHSVKLVN